VIRNPLYPRIISRKWKRRKNKNLFDKCCQTGDYCDTGSIDGVFARIKLGSVEL